MIQGKNLSVGYGTDVVIKDFSFHVEAGCITALIGPNGAGKSTLLKTLGGYLAPLSGSVLLGGRDALSISGQIYGGDVNKSQARGIYDLF